LLSDSPFLIDGDYFYLHISQTTMHRKKRPEYIIIAFVLIALSLLGIIVMQGYWTRNAYRQNKIRFDRDIDTAMSRALANCKKDYLEHIRVVLIRRLTSPDIKITVDSIPAFRGSGDWSMQTRFILSARNDFFIPESSIILNKESVEYYRKKVWYVAKRDIPAWITEVALYQPDVMKILIGFLSSVDVKTESNGLLAYVEAHPNTPVDSLLKNFPGKVKDGIYRLPKNYRRADSLAVREYFENELRRLNIETGFKLLIASHHIKSKPSGIRYSETDEFTYKYHGFAYIRDPNNSMLYMRAVFNRPQYTIMRGMVFNLFMSALLILFTTACFIYILRTILRQKKLAELKDDFINNMTHELKTPLATITVAIEGLQKFNALNDTEKTQRYLETSRSELNKLNDLVTKVLNIASFENNEDSLNPEEINIDELVNEVVASEKMKATKPVNISYVNPDKVETINADRLHLRNVLLNLVDNAVKYSGEKVDIAIAVYKEDGLLCFAVRDNGIGISQDNLKAVFDKFYRVPTGNLHNVKGTGLGLSYARSIIEAHGGSMTAKSELNKGSEFIFTLPLS
jgi:signal transduction histidine kinase